MSDSILLALPSPLGSFYESTAMTYDEVRRGISKRGKPTSYADMVSQKERFHITHAVQCCDTLVLLH
jgi:hypothetical protein